jgi:hypothetical protein
VSSWVGTRLNYVPGYDGHGDLTGRRFAKLTQQSHPALVKPPRLEEGWGV